MLLNENRKPGGEGGIRILNLDEIPNTSLVRARTSVLRLAIAQACSAADPSSPVRKLIENGQIRIKEGVLEARIVAKNGRRNVVVDIARIIVVGQVDDGECASQDVFLDPGEG